MKIFRSALFFALAITMIAGALFFLAPSDVQADNKPPIPTEEEGNCAGYMCNYCCETNCGCTGSGDFIGWCGCSSISCNRVCEWR